MSLQQLLLRQQTGTNVPYKLENDLGFLLARTRRAMRRWLMSKLDPLGITYEQFTLLTHL